MATLSPSRRAQAPAHPRGLGRKKLGTWRGVRRKDAPPRVRVVRAGGSSPGAGSATEGRAGEGAAAAGEDRRRKLDGRVPVRKKGGRSNDVEVGEGKEQQDSSVFDEAPRSRSATGKRGQQEGRGNCCCRVCGG